MARGQQWQKYLLGHHEFREIPLEDLFVDSAYQRELNEAAITRYVNGYDANLVEPITVNERKNGNGKPTYALLDGQHRRATAQKLGLRTLTCRVLHVDQKMEAELFVRLQRDRIHLNPHDAFKAQLAAKNAACIEIEKCLESRGLTVGPKSDTRSIAAVGALQKIYARAGFVGLGRLLDVIVLSWPEDETSRFVGNVMLGLQDFLDGGHYDINIVAEKLSRLTPDQLLAKANKRWHGHRALGETSKSVVNCITEAAEIAYRAVGKKGPA